MTLRLHPSRTPIPHRSCALKATGLLLLLHFLFIGAPLPASPFLLSTLFNGRQTASKFDLAFLAHFISADSLSLVKRIERVPLNRPVYTSQAEDSIEYQYLLNIPEVDVRDLFYLYKVPTLMHDDGSMTAEHDCPTPLSPGARWGLPVYHQLSDARHC